MNRALFTLAVLGLSLVAACADEDKSPEPTPTEETGTASQQLYRVGVRTPPPSVKGSFSCDEEMTFCECFGDEDCNDMFETLPCNTINSWCNQDMSKCFCDLDGGSYKDYM